MGGWKDRCEPSKRDKLIIMAAELISGWQDPTKVSKPNRISMLPCYSAITLQCTLQAPELD